MVKRSSEQPTLVAIGFKVFFGFVGFAALATEVSVLVERGLFDAANFFGYFTVLTNILIFVTFIVSAIALAHGKNNKLSSLRGAVTVYALMVGLGFTALYLGVGNIPPAANSWNGAVLHFILPLAVLLDYIFDRPLKTNFNKALSWLIFPLTYVTYTLMHGIISGWYPLVLLNPVVSGFNTVILTITAMIATAVLLTWVVVRFGKTR